MWVKNDPQIALFGKALDFSHLRQEALSDNIANADTPGYKRKDVSFDAMLAERVYMGLSRTHPQHIPGGKELTDPHVATFEDTRTRLDGNNVDVEVEMAKMAGNALYYDTMSQLTGTRFRMLNKIIDQGGRS